MYLSRSRPFLVGAPASEQDKAGETDKVFSSDEAGPGETIMNTKRGADSLFRALLWAVSVAVAFDEKLAYVLPRRGRGVEVHDGRGRKLYTLRWANDRFRLTRGARR